VAEYCSVLPAMIEGAVGLTVIDCNEGVGVGLGDELPPLLLQAIIVMRRNATVKSKLTRGRRIISPPTEPFM
jgi:hypothetical protein